MVLSVLVALILSPALAATLLQAEAATTTDRLDRPARSGGRRASSAGARPVQHRLRAAASTAIVGIGRHGRRPQVARSSASTRWSCAAARRHVLPAADRLPADRGPGRGAASSSAFPPARPRAARSRCSGRSSTISTDHEAKNVQTLFTVAGGGGGGGAGQNTGQGFINLAALGRAPRQGEHAPTRSSSARRARSAASATRRSSPWCPARSAASASRAASRWSCRTERHDPRSSSWRRATGCSQAANADPNADAVRLSDLPDVATLKVDINQEKLTALGLDQGDVNTTLSTAWGGRYVNDFIDRGRVKRVYVQGDAPYRADPEDLGQWYVRIGQRRDGAVLLLRADRAGRPRRAACRASTACPSTSSRASRRRA